MESMVASEIAKSKRYAIVEKVADMAFSRVGRLAFAPRNVREVNACILTWENEKTREFFILFQNFAGVKCLTPNDRFPAFAPL